MLKTSRFFQYIVKLYLLKELANWYFISFIWQEIFECHGKRIVFSLNYFIEIGEVWRCKRISYRCEKLIAETRSENHSPYKWLHKFSDYFFLTISSTVKDVGWSMDNTQSSICWVFYDNFWASSTFLLYQQVFFSNHLKMTKPNCKNVSLLIK